MHGYTMAFTWSAVIFLVGAVVAALLLRSGVVRAEAIPVAEPVLAA